MLSVCLPNNIQPLSILFRVIVDAPNRGITVLCWSPFHHFSRCALQFKAYLLFERRRKCSREDTGAERV